MRVLMFGWEFPPYQAGGLATATVGLVTGLLRTGVEVTLVVPFPADESILPGFRLVSADGPAESLRVHRIPSPLGPYDGAERYTEVFERIQSRRPIGSRAVYGAHLFEEVERFAALAGGIAAREPHDLIDTHDWISFAAGLEAQRVSKKPLVAHIHATEYDRSGEGGNPEIHRREREGLSAATRVISNSHVLKRQVVERFGVPADKVDVVHWGIGDDRTPPPSPAPSPFPPDVPVVLFLGRVTRQKGPDYFLEVAGRVSQFNTAAHFLVAGSGDLLPRLMMRAADLGIAHRVHFTGGLHGADVDRAFRMATVCVMPSVSEPFGLVALESLRAGTPCILPKTAGVAEVITNAFKVDFWDVDDIANKVVALLRYPVLRDHLSDLGLQELATERFSLEEPARRTRDAYQRAIEWGGIRG